MSNINQRLNGQIPLVYQGVPALQPTEFVNNIRDPLTTDSKNFYLGTWWLNTITYDLWYLANITGDVATWIKLETDNGLSTLTGNTGGVVSANASHNISFLSGYAGITINGNAGTHTLTINGSGTIATSFVTDAGTAIPASGILNIFGGLNINTSGAGNTVTVKTPTLAEGVVYANSSGVFSSLGKGTNGQVLIGSTAGIPAWNNVTSTGGSVTITNGANTINLEVGAAPPITTTVAFSAYKSAVTNAATGMGNQYFYIANTELFDIGANYNNATGIFTAPSNGYYIFYTNCYISGYSQSGLLNPAGTTAVEIGLVCSSGVSYQVARTDAEVELKGNAPLNVAWAMWGGSIFVQLTTGQTMKPYVKVADYNSQRVNVGGLAGARTTMFSGYKL